VNPVTQSSQALERVYVLQHSYRLEGCEETKFIGVYSTHQEAAEAIRRLQVVPGFRDYPTEFRVDEYPLGLDHWTEGFVIDSTS
jgi:hypothetical protein